MNIIIPPRRYQLWEQMTLAVPEPLDFRLNQQYVLHGDNGTGKSSFIKRVFLPAFEAQATPQMFLLAVTQDFLMQFYAIQAHAAFHRRNSGALASHEAALDYLLECYVAALGADDVLVAVFDETEAFAPLRPLLRKILACRAIVLLITHQRELRESLPQARTLEFTRVAPQQLEVRCVPRN